MKNEKVLVLSEYGSAKNYIRRLKSELSKLKIEDYLQNPLESSSLRLFKYAERYPDCNTIEELLHKGIAFEDKYTKDNIEYFIELSPLDFMSITIKQLNGDDNE